MNDVFLANICDPTSIHLRDTDLHCRVDCIFSGIFGRKTYMGAMFASYIAALVLIASAYKVG